jgi:alpha-1,3-glucosyltransferase
MIVRADVPEEGSYLLVSVVLLSLFVKYSVGLWGYSGQSSPPMYGDYEAQRHWMEVTYGLPLHRWYTYDLQYWGLDYPPLTAYVSWIIGAVAAVVYPPLIELEVSRGIETADSKIFMRISVLLCEVLVFIPAVILSCQMLKRPSATLSSSSSPASTIRSTLLVLTCLLSPGLVLIDHGHFQYNCVVIGFTLLGAVCIQRDLDVMSSVLFCLALNFKQMALYYSPVFFFVLLRKCLLKPTPLRSMIHLAKVGSAVVVSFAVLWAPFCVYRRADATCAESLLQIVSRLFPFSRGIFEDKVANLWYAASVVFDFRELFSIPEMARMSTAVTLGLLSPLVVDLLSRPVCSLRLTLALVISSLVFFLASFQVHEKSLLLALAPASLLVRDEPLLIAWMQILGCFTMFPLLKRDKLVIPYYATSALYALCCLLLTKTMSEEDRRSRLRSSLHLPTYLREVIVGASVSGDPRVDHKPLQTLM